MKKKTKKKIKEFFKVHLPIMLFQFFGGLLLFIYSLVNRGYIDLPMTANVIRIKAVADYSFYLLVVVASTVLGYGIAKVVENKYVPYEKR